MTDQAIDFDHLDRYVAGDAALRDEVLTIFEGQVARCLRLLDVDGPNEEWRSIAHALKGASRGIGAWEVGAVCEQAEKLSGTPDDVREARIALKQQIQACVETALVEIKRLRRT
ncbi:Hpt domain-containing protein [Parvularcula lutaonensis]|uniref:Hpt domain-containing protein n=1 Tax=Parvularcula lutaonensis TaxID=491923 RepID=A0ABV7M9I7_9PROT|nr:Hpt domain-containing protein [Parvularcula lutaonensis]